MKIGAAVLLAAIIIKLWPIILMIVVGLVREATGNLPQQNIYHLHGIFTIGHGASSYTSLFLAYALLKAFANGGASLTGIEAVSDAVGTFKPPEGSNARRVLMAEGVILGVLIAGISWLAHATHATPYTSGYPTVLAQEANMVFGQPGHFMFYVVQAATMLILYTGGNTSFNGFPFLTSYVAGDSFLPRWLLKRGHRLVFSNAIVLLTIVSIVLLIIKDADVNSLVPLYAIGVFTSFPLRQLGMVQHHRREREVRWRSKAVLNGVGAVATQANVNVAYGSRGLERKVRVCVGRAGGIACRGRFELGDVVRVVGPDARQLLGGVGDERFVARGVRLVVLSLHVRPGRAAELRGEVGHLPAGAVGVADERDGLGAAVHERLDGPRHRIPRHHELDGSSREPRPRADRKGHDGRR